MKAASPPRHPNRFAVAVLLVAATLATAAPEARADLDGVDAGMFCGADVVLLGVRGSGQSYQPDRTADYGFGPQLGAVRDGMDTARPAGVSLAATAADADYPAVEVSSGFFDGDYDGSVALGVDELLSTFRQLEGCGDPVGSYVLAGYSQGADVVRRAIDLMSTAEQDRIGAVLLLADPWFHPHLDAGVQLLGDSHESGCDDLDDCPQSGVLNSLGTDRPAVPTAIRTRTQSACLAGDIVCDYPQASLDPSVHTDAYQPIAADIGAGLWDLIASNHSGRFVDDDGSVFEADIEIIAAAGITRGCNPPHNTRYCPDDYVTRGQMAAFLNRALGP